MCLGDLDDLRRTHRLFDQNYRETAMETWLPSRRVLPRWRKSQWQPQQDCGLRRDPPEFLFQKAFPRLPLRIGIFPQGMYVAWDYPKRNP